MSEKQNDKRRRIALAKKIGLIAIGFFVAYVVVGFWVVPPLLKPRLEEQLSSLIGRDVTIESVKLNPLTLSATTTRLTVHETDGDPFAGFDELYVNAQLSSIFRWAATVKEIRLSGPFGVLTLLPDGNMNIDDILATLSRPDPEPAQDAGLPRAIVARLDVIDGKFTFENLTETEPVRDVVTPIAFTLENLSTLKDREGAYQFTGVGPLGGQFEISGTLTITPLRAQGSFSTIDTRLNHYWGHVKDRVSFQIMQGSASTSGDYAVALVDGRIDATLKNGSFELTDFELAEKGRSEVLVALPTLSVTGVSADLQTRKITVDDIQTADAAFKSWLAADGSVELQRLLQPDLEKLTSRQASSAPAAETEPWQVTVNNVEVEAWRFTVDDLTGSDPIRETVVLDSFTVADLSTAADQMGSYTLSATGPSGGQFRLDGTMTVNPVWTQGRYAATGIDLSHLWEHVKDHVSFQILKGSTGASGDYTAAMDDAAFSARLENGIVELNDFELVEKGQKEVLISIPTAAVQGIGANLDTREITIETIQTADARIKSWLGEDGQFELQRLFLSDLEKFKAQKTPGTPEPETAPGPPWHLALKKMDLSNYALAFEDRTLTKPATMTVDEINVVVENLSTRKDAKADVRVAMQINRAGTVTVDGTTGIDPLTADLTVLTDKIALKPFQPYVDDAVNVHIASGSSSSNGRIRYMGQEAKPQIRYEGTVSVDGVEIQDRVQTEDFFTLKQFKTSGIVLELRPNKLHATQVRIDQPHATVTIDQNGVVNVVNSFAPVEKKHETGQEDLLQRLVNLLILQFKGPMPMNVDKVLLTNFTANFVDESVSPKYTTHLELTRTTIDGLSSDPSTLADLKVDGNIDQSATIVGTGQMNPMNALKYSQMDFSLKDFSLEPISPYAGRFMGFKIDRGTLQTKLTYKVENDQVNGDNIIYIDNLELGDKVDSPDAPNLPIKLGVALLKDGDNRITLQIPVDGDVTDPQFDFAQAIESALTGTIEKAGSSPFTAIADIDGFKGEELRQIEFEYGSSDLSDREIRKLNALAKFLDGRETLALGIVGTADRQMDWAAILGEPLEPIAADDDAAADIETPEAPAQGPEVDVDALEAIAQRRAEQVADILTRQTGVAADRIQVKPVQINEAPEGAAGLVELLLSAE